MSVKVYTLSQVEVDGAISRQIIETRFLDTKYTANFDALLFTSKNGVKAFAKIMPDFIKYPAFVIGKESAKAVLEFGGIVEFIGEKSSGEAFANELQSKFANRQFLWARGREVAYNLTNALSGFGIKIDELIVYETHCCEDIKNDFDNNAYIVFSSPSTVKCFFGKNLWQNSFTAIAIGATTASELAKYGVNCYISQQQTLKAAVELAFKVSQNQS
jgi:uroporphyrinogen-III synthase